MVQPDFQLNTNPFDFPTEEERQKQISSSYNVNRFGVIDRPATTIIPQLGVSNGLSDQEAINTVWSVFSASNVTQRRLILTGLLTICCPSQLTFLMDPLRSACRTDPFRRLPKELSLRILLYLDAFSLGRAAQVSKLWKKLADDDLPWREMCQQHIEHTYVLTASSSSSQQQQLLVPTRPSSPTSNKDSTKPWKSVYSKRLALERIQRKGIYVKNFESSSFPILMTGSWDQTIRIWNVTKAETIQILNGHTRGIDCLQFDENKLISGGMDNVLRLWNWRTRECIKTINGSADSTIRIWNFNTGAGHVLRGHQEWVNTVKLDTKYFNFDDGLHPSSIGINSIKPSKET
ncbi:hypothetical protein PSHT_00648 [Puccinia striiformis]|uniref:F-box domain-containing protein n=1 Tax=Puccinia striiformis TaxID=27350 RepID=A0A2S4WM96_9BASI|nr:hypothetical protein PSHT_00648 [Puccinia striiformis]